jgi:hypothetical protein
MNPFQRAHQITIPSSEPVRKKGAEMINATKRRRDFQGRSFSKQTFYNCLILGLYDIEAKQDLDHDLVDEKGLLAVLIDRGATQLSRLVASADSPVLPRGVRASIGETDEDDERGVEQERPVAPKTHRKPPGLVAPRDWLAARNRNSDRLGRTERAEEETKPSGRRPVP